MNQNYKSAGLRLLGTNVIKAIRTIFRSYGWYLRKILPSLLILNSYGKSLRHLLTTFLLSLSFLSLSLSPQALASSSREDLRGGEHQGDERARRVVPPSQQVKDKLWILSVDGGGIRGLIPAYFLQYMEERVEHEVKDRLRQKIAYDLGHGVDASLLPPCPIYLSHCFDVMAGTSTGGIISLGLNIPQEGEGEHGSYPLPKYKASDLVKLYQDKGHIIFSNPLSLLGNLFKRKFDAKPIEEIFREYFGSIKLNQLISTTLVTAYEMRQEQLLVLDSSKAKLFNDQNFYTKDAARSTSAAPTFFSAAEVKNMSNQEYLFADGGLIANNPALVAYLRGQSLYPKAKRVILLSLGTGTSVEDNLSELKDKGLLGWAPEVASVMMKGVSDLSHEQLRQQADTLGKEVFDYTRIQIPLSKKRSEMDNVTPDNLKYLLQLAKKEAESSKALKRFITLLAEDVAEHYSLFPSLSATIQDQLHKGSKVSLTANREFKEIDEIKAWAMVNAMRASTHIITALDLNKFTLTPRALQYLLKDRFLQELSLKESNVTKAELSILRDKGVQLSSLSLAKNTELKDEAIAFLTREHFPELKHLNVFNTNLTDQGVKVLVQHLPALRGLEIGGNTLTPQGVKHLLDHMRELKSLNLSRSDGSYEVIEALKGGLSLTSLDLSHNKIDDRLLSLLLKAIKGKEVSSLSLTVNELTEESGHRIGEYLQEDDSLTFLDLTNNNLSNEGTKSILNALGLNRTLKVLKLSMNFIGEEGIAGLPEMLKVNSTLAELSLTRNEDSLSTQGLELLKRAQQIRRVFKLDY